MTSDDLRAFISGLYTEKLIWAKDPARKKELWKHRNDIETNDAAFYAELVQINHVVQKTIDELEPKLKEKYETNSWESVSK